MRRVKYVVQTHSKTLGWLDVERPPADRRDPAEWTADEIEEQSGGETMRVVARVDFERRPPGRAVRRGQR